MNIAMKVGAAGALALAGVAAHASIPSPSNSSADAVLFGEVLNAAGTAAVASFAGDTGVSISTLLSGTYSGTVLGSDANLAKLFAADAAGDTLEWGVMGAQGTSGTPQFVTTTNGSATNKIKNITNSTLGTWATGFAADISTINSNINGAAASIYGTNPATSGVWDVTNTVNTNNWYGTLNTANALASATATGTASLFSELTNGSSGITKGTYATVESLSFSSGGLTFTGSGNPPPPVPLPPAVWLLGSGLLGLAGVARRKSKA
jgi:hypothetical protein